MKVKPAERRAENSFNRNRETQVDSVMDHSQLSADVHELRYISEKIGRLIALARAEVLDAIQAISSLLPYVGSKSSSVSVARPSVTPAYRPTAPGIAVAEITPASSTSFARSELSTVYGWDLDRFSLQDAAQWIARARQANRLLPQIVVVAPRRRLSNQELGFISEEIAHVAVFIQDRPAANFDDVLRILQERIGTVLEPKRLIVETSFNSVGEAPSLFVPRI